MRKHKIIISAAAAWHVCWSAQYGWDIIKFHAWCTVWLQRQKYVNENSYRACEQKQHINAAWFLPLFFKQPHFFVTLIPQDAGNFPLKGSLMLMCLHHIISAELPDARSCSKSPVVSHPTGDLLQYNQSWWLWRLLNSTELIMSLWFATWSRIMLEVAFRRWVNCGCKRGWKRIMLR